MEGGSDGEIPERNHENNKNSNSKFNNSRGAEQAEAPDEDAFQLETLEKAYALETYPSESIRAKLSEKLGLSDLQLQMWFCHRRLKEKKEELAGPSSRKRKVVVPNLPDPPMDDLG